MYKYLKTPAILILTVLIAAFAVAGCGGDKSGAEKESAENVKISIGYQAQTAQSWGALVIKNKKLFEKHLEAKFPDKDFTVEWVKLQSDSELNDNLISGKLQMAFLGDIASLVNGEKGQTMQNYHSVFLAFDGKIPEVKTLVLDGNEIKVDSLEGIVGNRDWAEGNRGYVVAFMRALIEAHQVINKNAPEAAKILAAEAGKPAGEAGKTLGKIRYDAAMYHRDVKNLKANRQVMKKSGEIKDVDLATFINDYYIEEAAKEMKVTYPSEQQLAGKWLDNLKL